MATTNHDRVGKALDLLKAEVGAQRGRKALDRLRNVVGRVESLWRPASAERLAGAWRARFTWVPPPTATALTGASRTGGSSSDA